MLAITITEDIKVQNELSQAIGTIMTRSSYPNKFWVTERVVGGYASRTDLHEADGWGNVINPTLGANQKRGQLIPIEDSPDYTYEVIDKSEEEIQQEQIAASEANREALIQAKLQAVPTLWQKGEAV